MLQYLAIQNFALIDRIEVEFSSGLNLLTGETGSGKSILIDAVGQLIGDRASLESIRAGTKTCSIEGVFRVVAQHPGLKLLANQGIPVEGREILIRRVISPLGSKVFINDCLSTQHFLSDLGRSLAYIHGQDERHGLFRSQAQLDYLDVFASKKVFRNEVTAAYIALVKLRETLTLLNQKSKERAQEIEDIRFQLKGLKNLGLKPGLYTELEKEKHLLTTARRRAKYSLSAYNILYDDDSSVLSLLSQVKSEASKLSELDPQQNLMVEQIEDSRILLNEISGAMRDLSQGIELDQDRLDEIEDHMSSLQKARRRYQKNSDQDLIAVTNQLQKRLENLLEDDQKIKNLIIKEKTLHEIYLKKAKMLSLARRKASSKLASRVEKELRKLAMEKCRFNIEVCSREAGPLGIDSVEFNLSSNIGEDPLPINRIASGGELSRLALALKSISNVDVYSKSLIFDEIDAGIGGRTASAVASKLVGVSRGHQVLCVTHIAQIAAFADLHFHVSKVPVQGRTEVRILKLETEERKVELARMLAGDQVSKTSLMQAAELLETGIRLRTVS